jgi:hypothetical protein
MSLLLSLSLTTAVTLFAAPAHAQELTLEQPSPAPSQLIAQDPTVLAFQTNSYSVRIFTREGQLIMNVFDRQTNYLWLRDVVVAATSNLEGYVYTPVSTEYPAIEVFQSQSDPNAASFAIENSVEFATVVTVTSTPSVEGVPPVATLPPSAMSVATCRTFSHTASIYRQEGRTLMDMTNRADDVTWLRGVPVSITSRSEGADYSYSGEATVEVFTSAFDGSCAIAINDNAPEFGSQWDAP